MDLRAQKVVLNLFLIKSVWFIQQLYQEILHTKRLELFCYSI